MQKSKSQWAMERTGHQTGTRYPALPRRQMKPWVLLHQNYALKNRHGTVITLPMCTRFHMSLTKANNIIEMNLSSLWFHLHIQFHLHKSTLKVHSCSFQLINGKTWNLSYLFIIEHCFPLQGSLELTGNMNSRKNWVSQWQVLRKIRPCSHIIKEENLQLTLVKSTENPTDSTAFHTVNTLPKNPNETKQNLQSILVACNPSMSQD